MKRKKKQRGASLIWALIFTSISGVLVLTTINSWQSSKKFYEIAYKKPIYNIIKRIVTFTLSDRAACFATLGRVELKFNSGTWMRETINRIKTIEGGQVFKTNHRYQLFTTSVIIDNMGLIPTDGPLLTQFWGNVDLELQFKAQRANLSLERYIIPIRVQLTENTSSCGSGRCFQITGCSSHLNSSVLGSSCNGRELLGYDPLTTTNSVVGAAICN